MVIVRKMHDDRFMAPRRQSNISKTSPPNGALSVTQALAETLRLRPQSDVTAQAKGE